MTEIGSLVVKWAQMIQSVDDEVLAVANNARISPDELRRRYVMACLNIEAPYQHDDEKYNINTQKTESVFRVRCPVMAVSEYQDTGIKNGTVRNNSVSQRTIDISQSENCRKATNNYNKGLLNYDHGRHRIKANALSEQKILDSKLYSNQFEVTQRAPQMSFYSESAPDFIAPTNQSGVKVNPFHLHVSDDYVNRNGTHNYLTKANTQQSTTPLQLQISQPKKVSKLYCDIEAALAGEISDFEDNEELVPINRRTSNNKLSSESTEMPHINQLLAKRRMLFYKEHLKDRNLSAERVVRYPNGKPLALNVFHKVYVISLENAYAWVRLCDDELPPCFDSAHVMLSTMKSMEWKELFPGVPCVVLARFNPLDVVNDGIAREIIGFDSYARAVIEECDGLTKTATVRLVDFGFRLTQLAPSAIKPLTIDFDGPPLALRLQLNLLPKPQREKLCRYATYRVRLTMFRNKQFLCWRKTWAAVNAWKLENYSQIHEPQPVPTTTYEPLFRPVTIRGSRERGVNGEDKKRSPGMNNKPTEEVKLVGKKRIEIKEWICKNKTMKSS